MANELKSITAQRGPSTAWTSGVPSFNVLGTRIHALTFDRAMDLIAEVIRSRTRGYICVCTVNDIVECMKDQDVRLATNGAWLATTDGMPLVWWGKLAGHRNITRVYGPEIMRAVLAHPRHRFTRHFFYGGTPKVLELLEAEAKRLNPSLFVAGKAAPPFRPLTPREEDEYIRLINKARPDIVWVGLGSPKQNVWMARMRPHLEAPLLVGVGAAFDFIAGVKPQAPRCIQRSGFEWLFRLLCEPKRLWRRYLVNNTVFLLHAFAYWTGLRCYPDDLSPPQTLREGGP